MTNPYRHYMTRPQSGWPCDKGHASPVRKGDWMVCPRCHTPLYKAPK